MLRTEGRNDFDGSIVPDEGNMELNDSIGVFIVFEKVRLNACDGGSPIEVELNHLKKVWLGFAAEP